MSIFFRNASIKNKLRVIILLTSAIVLSLSTTAYVVGDLFAFRRDMVNNLFILADLVGINSIAGLLFYESETVQENIAALKDGTLFASYFREGVSKKVLFTNVHEHYAHHNSIKDQVIKEISVFHVFHGDWVPFL